MLRRIAPLVATGVLLLMAVYSAVALTDERYAESAGYDFAIYRDAAARWLHGGFFYYPEQITGPYVTISGDIMYPPPAILLFAPFTVLPAALWWAVPLGIIGSRVWALRPSPWGWAGMAACLAWPMTVELVYTGNPLLWIVAALALATRWPWVSVLILIKPSLLPFALFGIRTRAWWFALGAGALVSALFVTMWPDWIRVILNARGPYSGPLYSLKDVPMMLIPIVAWIGRSSRRAGPAPEGTRRGIPVAGGLAVRTEPPSGAGTNVG